SPSVSPTVLATVVRVLANARLTRSLRPRVELVQPPGGTGFVFISKTGAPRSPLVLRAGATPNSARSVSSASSAAARASGLSFCWRVPQLQGIVLQAPQP